MRSVANETSNDTELLRSFGSMFDEWMSPAAERFSSHQYHGSFGSLALVVRDADDLARILDDLADQLDAKLSRIRTTARNIRSFFQFPPAWACPTEDDDRYVWDRIPWRYKPWNMPANDSPEWLTIGHHFRTVYGVDV